MTAAATYDGESSLTITNTYAAEGTVELEATKEINDWGKAESFTFKLAPVGDAPMPGDAKTVEATVTQNELTAKFGEITYTEAGEYSYTITETDDGVAGITYDTDAHEVIVTVVDNHDGTLTATPKYDGEDSLTITNTYAAEGKVELEATKEINDWGKAESFTFTLAPVGEAPMPGDAAKVEETVTKDELTAKFGEICYTAEGEYRYTITEADDGIAGITYDTDAHEVVVTVVDNHDGTMTATPKYDGEDSLTITNTYAAEGKIELEATKEINDWGKAESFTFTLAPVGEAPMPGDAAKVEETVTKNGLTAKFGEICYTEEGEYRYTITETDDGVEGITYDTTAHEVVVTVVDNHDGTMTATPKYDGGESLTITNTYAAAGDVVLEATKEINSWGKAESFTFILAAVGEAPMPEAGGETAKAEPGKLKAVFGTIHYEAEGTYEYTITEQDDKVTGITYDTTPHKVVVEVVDNKDGTMTATPKYDGKDSLTITNTYAAEGKAQLFAKKSLEGKTLEEGMFSFKLTGPKVAEAGEVKKNDKDGKAAFDEISFTLDELTKEEGGKKFDEFEYTIEEVLPEGVTEKNPQKDGITYDTHKEVVKVKVADAGDGTLKVTYNGADTFAGAAFTNTYKEEKTEATVVKVWNDSNNSGNTRPSELRVTLLADGVEKLTVTLPDPVTGWTKQVTNLDKYTKDGKEIKYTWGEAVPAGYRLTNTETKGTVTTLTNTLTERREEFTEATIIKIWNDNNNAGNVRPVSLVVTLMADGSPIQSVTLSAANGWSYTRTGLPMYRDGRAIRYTWSEALPAGYTLTSYVNNGTITSLTNSHQEEFQSTVLGAQRGQVLGANRAKTGDESDLLLWMTLMMASAAGLLAAFKKRKRA